MIHNNYKQQYNMKQLKFGNFIKNSKNNNYLAIKELFKIA